jgi:hypothetical protein
MDALRLFAAPIDPTSQVSSQSTSLVHIPGRALATRTQSPKDTASPSVNDIWTVSVGDDGTFNFYAVPGQTSAKHSQQSDSTGQGSSAVWGTPQTDVAARYAQYAALASPYTGQYLNIYA